jgi:hypothetical protein
MLYWFVLGSRAVLNTEGTKGTKEGGGSGGGGVAFAAGWTVTVRRAVHFEAVSAWLETC